MSKTKVNVKSKPGMFMKHDIAINARKAQKQSESEFKGRNAKEKSESASTTWKVHEQDELAARPCWRLWTVPDLQKTFDHNDDYVKILQSAQPCKSYGGRNILKPKWRNEKTRNTCGRRRWRWSGNPGCQRLFLEDWTCRIPNPRSQSPPEQVDACLEIIFTLNTEDM